MPPFFFRKLRDLHKSRVRVVLTSFSGPDHFAEDAKKKSTTVTEPTKTIDSMSILMRLQHCSHLIRSVSRPVAFGATFAWLLPSFASCEASQSQTSTSSATKSNDDDDDGEIDLVCISLLPIQCYICLIVFFHALSLFLNYI